MPRIALDLSRMNDQRLALQALAAVERFRQARGVALQQQALGHAVDGCSVLTTPVDETLPRLSGFLDRLAQHAGHVR